MKQSKADKVARARRNESVARHREKLKENNKVQVNYWIDLADKERLRAYVKKLNKARK